MTKRESHKTVEKFISTRFDVIAILGFLIALLSVIFDLPDKETFLGYEIDIQLLATIVSIIGFGVFGAWFFLRAYSFYLNMIMKYEIKISGNSFPMNYPKIKIENNEPIDFSNIHVKVVRFTDGIGKWNFIDAITSKKSNNFFSNGLLEVNRTVSRKPIFITIARNMEKSTEILFDDIPAIFPLHEQDTNFRIKEYEMVLVFTGEFVDNKEPVNLGKYLGKLVHKQRRFGENWQNDFEFSLRKTSDKEEARLKKEREKHFGIPLYDIPPNIGI